MSAKLLPCPFCGASLIKAEELSTRRRAMFTHPDSDAEDDCRCPAGNVLVWSDNGGVAAWNRRTPDLAAATALLTEAAGVVEPFARLGSLVDAYGRFNRAATFKPIAADMRAASALHAKITAHLGGEGGERG